MLPRVSKNTSISKLNLELILVSSEVPADLRIDPAVLVSLSVGTKKFTNFTFANWIDCAARSGWFKFQW